MVTEKDIRDMMTNLEKWIDSKIKDNESISKRHNDPEIIKKCMQNAKNIALDFMERNDHEKASRLFEQIIDYKKDIEILFYQAKSCETQGKLYLACIYYAFAACLFIESDIENIIDNDYLKNYVHEFDAILNLALIYSSSKNLVVNVTEYNNALTILEGDASGDFITDGMKKLGISRDFNDQRRQSAEFFIWKLLIKYVDLFMNNKIVLDQFKDKLSFLKYAYSRVIFILKSRNKNSLLEQYMDDAKNMGLTQKDLDKLVSKFLKAEQQPVLKESKLSQLKHVRSEKQEEKRQPKKSKPAVANNELSSTKEEKKEVNVSELLSSKSTKLYQRQYNYKLNLATPIEKSAPTQPSLDVSEYLKSPIKRAENLRMRTTPESDDNNRKIGFLAEKFIFDQLKQHFEHKYDFKPSHCSNTSTGQFTFFKQNHRIEKQSGECSVQMTITWANANAKDHNEDSGSPIDIQIDREIKFPDGTKELKRRYCDVKSTRKGISEDSYISLSKGQLECAKNNGLTLFRVHNVTEHSVNNYLYYKVKIPKETNNQYFNFQITDMTFLVPGRIQVK